MLNTLEKKQGLQKLEYPLEFEEIICDLLEDEIVLKMKDFKQHYETSCYDHSKSVAYYSYLLCKKWGCDYRSAARGRNAT